MNSPGKAIALDNPDNDLGLPLTIDGIQGSWFPAFKSILTAMSFGLDGNFQFTHTCRDVIYAYVFGDRITQLRVDGLAFADSCTASSPQGSGIELALGYYRANRISQRQTPIQVQVGTTAAGRFRGFLTNFRGEIVRPEARIAQFSMILHVFP
jgi:hypothetical protein